MKKLRTEKDKTLVIAIGNSGRGDDGLGWKFADLLQEHFQDVFDIEYRYQLQVEDAGVISHYKRVIFADASHENLNEGFEIKPCNAAAHFFYSSHLQSPETVLFLAAALFEKYPDAYILAIGGFDWELKTSLSDQAENNLQSAFTFFEKKFLPSLVTNVVAE